VFLLSYAELEKYFPDSIDYICEPTAYSLANHAWLNEEFGSTWWWLRSPGSEQNFAAGIREDLVLQDNTVYFSYGGVRPAMWITIQESAPEAVSIPASSVTAGQKVLFGHYEQDNNTANGAEPIEWYVLDCDEQGVLLISRYSLDSKPFHDREEDVNWGKSTLRLWLNSSFYEAAFSDEEKAHVVVSRVEPAKDMSSETEILTDQEGVTEDKVYLLSRDEWLEKYRSILWDAQYDSRPFTAGMISMSAPKTVFAANRPDSNDRDVWWLRGEVHEKTSDYPYSNLTVVDGYCPCRDSLSSVNGIRPLIHVDSAELTVIQEADYE